MITLSEAKAYMGVTSTANDTSISLFIDLVTAEIESYCDRKLLQTSYTGETLNYLGSEFDAVYNPELDVNNGDHVDLFLRESPVQTLVLKYDGTTIDSDNYVYDYKRGHIKLYKYFDDYQDKLTADYTAGYTTTTGSTYTIPTELKLVAYEGVKSYYSSSAATTPSDTDVKSKTVGDFSVTYGDDRGLTTSSTNLSKTYILANQKILDRYKRQSI